MQAHLSFDFRSTSARRRWSANVGVFALTLFATSPAASAALSPGVGAGSDASVLANGDAGASGLKARCDVVLNLLSYDDPGVDDSELLELELKVLAGTPSRWGDCGVHRLELLNGATPVCEPYRIMTLAELPIVGEVSRVRFCGATNPSVFCQPSGELQVVLKNGWLQNGPDALRLLDPRGKVLRSYSYGSGDVGPCGDTILPSESGAHQSPSGAVTDDVILWCADVETYVNTFLDERGVPAPDACAAAAAPQQAPADAGSGPEPEGHPHTGPFPNAAEPKPGRIYDGGVTGFRVPRFIDAGQQPTAMAEIRAKTGMPSLGCVAVVLPASRSPGALVLVGVLVVVCGLRADFTLRRLHRRRAPSRRAVLHR